jgi:hypothetical protein
MRARGRGRASGPQGSKSLGSVHQSSFRTKCSGTSLILFVMPINSPPWPTITRQRLWDARRMVVQLSHRPSAPPRHRQPSPRPQTTAPSLPSNVIAYVGR